MSDALLGPGSSGRGGGSRGRFALSAGIGATATALIAAAMAAGSLSQLERVTLDWRFRLFDASNPPPSDRVVHIDINDRSIQTVGRWPWPRAKLADVVDELAIAGTKVIAFDVLLTHPQEPRVLETPVADGSPPTYERIDDDAKLAAAIERAGNVVLALNLGDPPRPDDLMMRVRAILERDIATPLSAIATELSLDESARRRVEDPLAGHRSDVIRGKVRALFAAADRSPTYAEARAALLPNLPAYVTASSELSMLADEHRWARSMNAIAPMSIPAAAAPAGVHDAGDAIVPIPDFAEHAAGIGAVYFRHDPDGVVRTVPLWLSDGERAYPHLSLAVAALYTGTPIDNAIVTGEATTIRAADQAASLGRDIVIPTMDRRPGDGWIAPACNALVTWPTNHEWRMLFDPANSEPVQHLPVGVLVEVAELRRTASLNRSRADVALIQQLSLREFGYDASLLSAYAASAESDEIASLASHRGKAVEHLEFVITEYDGEGATAEERAVAASVRRALDLHREALTQAAEAERQVARHAAELRDRLDGRIALIGWTATASIADFVPTSLEAKVPGPVIHGALLNAILTDHFVKRVPMVVDVMLVLAIGLLATVIAASLNPISALAATAALIGGYFALNGWALFDAMDRWAVAAAPCLAAAASWAFVTVYRLFIEQRQRLAITRQFKNYIDPSLVELLVRDPTRIVKGEHELSCMFSDIAGFTTISEKLGTDQTELLLNKYLARATDALMAHRGTVNKYLGDGILAFWGAPVTNERHAMDTCIGALALRDAVVAVNADPDLAQFPKLFVRVGIASGPVKVGDFGAPPRRSDYTVIGDTVNFAARLESANKQFGTQMLISERTRELVGDVMLTRPIGRLVVVGKKKPEPVHELLNTREAATPEQVALAEATTAAITAYYASDFRLCFDLFEQIALKFGRTKLCDRYAAACQDHLAAGTDPRTFDGSLVLTEK